MDKLLGDAEMRGKEAEPDAKAGVGPVGQAWGPGESKLSQDRPLRHSTAAAPGAGGTLEGIWWLLE